MNKNVSPTEAGDIVNTAESKLSEDELRVFTEGQPADDITATIQDSFIRKPDAPDISNETELIAFRDTVKEFLRTRTFGAFPEKKPLFNQILEYRALDGGKYGQDIFSFVSEEGWRLKVDIHWAHKPDSANPLIIVLRNYDEGRWDSESYADRISSGQNIAFLEVRGIGEAGWAPGLQWHVRRASAWTGRTVASMQVYDLLRCIEFCRTLPGVDPDKIAIAARDEMSVVALYAALMDGKCESVVLKNPTETQDQTSDPDGKVSAVEMLNCLRITDVYQLPALLFPRKISFVGNIPPSYLWSEKVLEKLGKESFSIIQE
jgi:hypothetical protein